APRHVPLEHLTAVAGDRDVLPLLVVLLTNLALGLCLVPVRLRHPEVQRVHHANSFHQRRPHGRTRLDFPYLINYPRPRYGPQPAHAMRSEHSTTHPHRVQTHPPQTLPPTPPPPPPPPKPPPTPPHPPTLPSPPPPPTPPPLPPPPHTPPPPTSSRR